MQLALSLIGARPGTLLDLGGGPGFGGEFAALLGRFDMVSCLNLDPGAVRASGGSAPVQADARQLPFVDRAFDWVFCNAMIEHVGGWRNQQAVATEIRRVCRKGYFVATPNRFFPIEPHTLMPGYQFLPEAAQRLVIPLTPGYLKHYEPIDLLSCGQLRELFPEATVVGSGAPVLPTSVIAYWKA